MAREIKKLTARKVATLKNPGRHSDGGGLYLAIATDGATRRRRWVFIFRWQGRLREMGSEALLLCRSHKLAGWLTGGVRN